MIVIVWEDELRRIFAKNKSISRMFVMCVKTNWEEFLQKVNKFREKDEFSRMFVCVLRRI